MNRYDIHIHLAGIGDGSPCFVSKRMRRSIVYQFLLRQQKLSKGQGSDLRYVQKLNQLMKTQYLDAGVLFAMDAVITDEGEVDWQRSHTYIPNDYLFDVCRQSDKLLPGVSINPYRRDALEQLQEAIHQGAVVLKWLPNLQHFDPTDRRCEPIYRLLAQSGLPLVAHTGCEHTFPKMDQALGDARLYKKALDLGVVVIMSHCGVGCPVHRRYDCSKTIFELFKSYDNLYADTSALSSLLKFYHLHKLDFLTFHERLVHGSDYPIPPFALSYLFPLGFKKTWELARNDNPLERDILIKKAMKLPGDIFTNAGKILDDRVSYWARKKESRR